MSEPTLAIVVTCGERAVCHAVDPALPAGELLSELALYLGPAPPPATVLVRCTDERAVPLDPHAPIGVQVPAEAEIDLRPRVTES